MKTKILIITFFSLLSFSCNKEDGFLTRYPLDQLTDETFWTNEKNVRTFSYGFYPGYFIGYGAGWTWGEHYVRTGLSDNYGQSSPAQFIKVIPSSGGGWSFTWVRKANIFIDRIQTVPMSEEAKNHWTGVGRFFRGLEYFDLVKRFGDVPWYDKPAEASETDYLFKAKDSRNVVMSNVLEDFKFAAEHVRASDGVKGLTVNKMVVLAYMSRVFLFEGTWQKYHGGNQAKATEFLEAAKWAANEVITKGGYSFSHPYRASFNSLDLSTNKEMIMYKKYDIGQATHSLVSYVNREGQTGPNKDLVDAYLASNGLPYNAANPVYDGDKTISAVRTDRDSRLHGTIAPDLRPNGYVKPAGTFFGASTTGYAVWKYLNEEIMNTPQGLSNVNITDAPIIRYGEVVLNYAEAAYELGGLTQADLDKSINLLRSRPGSNLPKLQIIGGEPAVNGVTYDDPERDPTVPAMLWEIRRERRIELAMEGFRYDDLRRWAKLAYMDTQQNLDLNRGAWIKRSDFPNLSNSVKIEGNASEGYIIPATATRVFTDSKVYLNPIPLDQIKLYKDQGVDLVQNPGWQ